MTSEQNENGIWFNGLGARESDIRHAERAAAFLGNLVVRVVSDPSEAQNIVLGIKAEELREKYPDESAENIDRVASMDAAKFVTGMEPSAANGQDPMRLIRVESTDGSYVPLDELYGAARNWTDPDTGQVTYEIQ